MSAILTLLLLLALSALTAQEVEVATTIAFTEGPTADAEGNIFFTDQANNRIMKLAVDGKLSTFRQPANYANGLVFDSQWRLIACEAGDKSARTPPRVTRTDLRTDRIEILAEKDSPDHSRRAARSTTPQPSGYARSPSIPRWEV